MNDKRHWYDERVHSDAPVLYDMPEALAWASGYNAAVQALKDEMTKVSKKENV